MRTTKKVRILMGSHPVSPKFVTEAVMCIKTKSEEKGQSITATLWVVFKYVTQNISALITSYHQARQTYSHKQHLCITRCKYSYLGGGYFYNARWWFWNKADTCCTTHSKENAESICDLLPQSSIIFTCVSQLDVTRNDCAHTQIYRNHPAAS